MGRAGCKKSLCKEKSLCEEKLFCGEKTKHKKRDSDWRGHLAIERQVQEAMLALEADQDPVTDITRDRPEQELLKVLLSTCGK